MIQIKLRSDHKIMPKTKKDLLEFWEDQMRLSHTSSNYFFRKSPSHYHMMLIVMHAYKYDESLSVEELKTKLFKTSRPKSALMIKEACDKRSLSLKRRVKIIENMFCLPRSLSLSSMNI